MAVSRPLTASLALLGPGLIGSALLAQLAAQAPFFGRLRTVVGVVAIANSRRMLLSPQPLALGAGATWPAALAGGGGGAHALDLSALGPHLLATCPPGPRIIVDCTASEEPPKHYARWLEAGIHVITPNKKAGAGPLGDYRAAKAAQAAGHAHFYYEVRTAPRRACASPAAFFALPSSFAAAACSLRSPPAAAVCAARSRPPPPRCSAAPSSSLARADQRPSPSSSLAPSQPSPRRRRRTRAGHRGRGAAGAEHPAVAARDGG